MELNAILSGQRVDEIPTDSTGERVQEETIQDQVNEEVNEEL